MILRLCAPDFAPVWEQTAADPAFRLFLENAARAHREGKHVLSFDLSLYQKAREVADLSRDALAALDNAKLRASDTSTLWRDLAVRIQVGPRQAPPGWADDHRTFVLPYPQLVDSAQLQRSVVVGEDLNDTKVFARLADEWGRVHARGFLSRIDILPGGGDRSADVAEIALAQQRMVLLVTDSDQKHPTDGLGSTARKARALESSHPFDILKVQVLEANEIENLLPASLVRDATSQSRQSEGREHIDEALRLGLFPPTALQASPPRVYIDLKGGLSGRTLDREDATSSYGHAVAKQIHGHIPARSTACLQECSASGAKPCTCFVTPALGDRLLKAVVGWVEDPRHAFKLAHYFADHDNPLWRDLAPHAFAFGCALPPQTL